MINVSTGGGLEWNATINTDDYDAAVDRMANKLNVIAEAALQSAQKQEAAIKGIFEETTGNTSGNAVITAYEQISQAASQSAEKQQQAAEQVNQAFEESTRELEDYFSAINKANASFKPVDSVGFNPEILDTMVGAFAGINSESQAFIQNINRVNAELDKNRINLLALQDAYKAGTVSEQEYEAELKGLSDQSKTLQTEFNALIQNQKQFDQQNNNSLGRIVEKKEALKSLVAQYENLTTAERESEGGLGLTQDIKDLKAEIQSLSLDNVTEGAKKAVSAMTQLRQLKQQIVETSERNPNDPQLQAMITQAAELTDRIGDVNAGIKLIGSDTAALDALASGIKGIFGGFTALQGLMGVFSDDNKDVEETIKNVTSAMAILQGLQEVGNVLDKNSALNLFLTNKLRQEQAATTAATTLATEELVVAQEGEAVTAAAATVATEGLNAAIAANPAGILLLAITAVVVALQSYISSSKDAAAQQKEMNDALAEANNLLSSLANLYSQHYRDQTQAAENAIALAQAQGKSENEILQLRKQALEAKRQEAISQLAVLGYNGANTEETRKQLAFQQTQLTDLVEREQVLLNIKATTGELTKEEQKRLELLQSQEKAVKSSFDPGTAAYQQLLSATAGVNQNLAEQAKKAYDDSLKSAAAAAEARLALAQKNTAAELSLEIATIKTRTQVDLDNANLTSGERQKILANEQAAILDAQRRFAILQLDNQKALLLAQLDAVQEGSAAEYALRSQLIQNNAEKELAQEGVTEERKRQIRADAIRQTNDLLKQQRYELAQQDLQTQQAILNDNLTRAREGSQRQLSLQEQLIDNRLALDQLAANKEIENEQLLNARLHELHAKAVADKKKLEDDYLKYVLDKRLAAIQETADLANIPLQGVTSDPTATAAQKRAAQQDINQNLLNSLNAQIVAVDRSIVLGTQTGNELLEKRAAIYKQLLELIQKINNQNKQDKQAQLSQTLDIIQAIAGGFQTIGQSIGELNPQLSQTVSELGQVAANATSAAKAFLSGDPMQMVQAGINIITSYINVFVEASKSKRQAQAEILDFQARIAAAELDSNIALRDRLRLQAESNKLTLDRIQSEEKLLAVQKQQSQTEYDQIFQQLQQEQYIAGQKAEKGHGSLVFGLLNYFTKIGAKTTVKDELESLAGKSYDDLQQLFNSGQLTDKAKALFEQLQKLKQEGVSIDEQLQQIQEQAKELFTGTTSTGIIDSIRDGFAQGFTSVEQFASKTQDVIRGAMLKALETKVLEGSIQKIYDQFSIDAEDDGGLDDQETKTFTDSINATIQKGLEFAKQIEKATGVNLSNANSTASNNNNLIGAYKQLTEQTGQVLAGTTNGIRLIGLEQLNQLKLQTDYQKKIEENTFGTAAKLDTLIQKFNSYETGAKGIHML